MGLDMYLSKKECVSSDADLYLCTGSTLYRETPIGYWRKAYSVDDYITDIIFTKQDASNDNCVDFYLDEDDCLCIYNHCPKMIKELKNKLKEIPKTDPKFEDLKWEIDDWQNTKKFFKEALDFLKEDSADHYRSIIYSKWY